MAAHDIGLVDTLPKAMAEVLSCDIALIIAIGDVLLCCGRCFGGWLSHRWREASDSQTKTKHF
jgi:hypothetical protein